MYHLMYNSIANKGISDATISNILETARDFNAKNNITGCLLFHNDTFLQILEGEEHVVKGLYKKIRQDTRHQVISFLEENNNVERVFNNWSMAYHKFGNHELNDITKALFSENFLSLAKLADKPSHAIKLFWHMAQQILEEG